MNKPRRAVIIQSNRLIEAHYQLTIAEQRLIFAMISMIETTDEDFKSYKIRLIDLAELWDITQDVVYREAKKITARLMKRLLQITESDGTLIQLHWICLSVHKPGYIILQFHPLLKPYLLQLKGAFTKCNLYMLNQFQSIHTVRIYQLLKQYEKIGRRTFLIDDLKEILGIEKTQYKVFTDFRKRVLNQARKELDMRGDITFDLEGIERGRKVEEITFNIIDKNNLLSENDENKAANIKKAISQAASSVNPPPAAQPSNIRRRYIPDFEGLDKELFHDFLEYAKEHDSFIYNRYLEEGYDMMVKYEYIKFLEK